MVVNDGAANSNVAHTSITVNPVNNNPVAAWFMGNGNIQGTAAIQNMAGWTAVATGDFNHDGTADVMWKNASGLVAEWFMGSGAIQATAAVQNMPGSDAIASGDFDGDGNTDVLWRDLSGVTEAWLMKDGAIGGTVSYGSTAGWNVLAAGDFDHDGLDDIMWQNTTTGAVTTWSMTATAEPLLTLVPATGGGAHTTTSDYLLHT